MPSKGSKKRATAQGKNARGLEKQTRAEYLESQRELNRQRRELEKQQRADDRARDKELKAVLRQASATGLYNPKSTELTPYRRRRLEKIKRENRELLDNTKTIFVPIKEGNKRKIRERATNLHMTTTKKGVFVSRDGHKSASLKYDRKHDEYYIERRGKTKRGPNRGRIYKDHIPLASIDELEKEVERLRRAADRLKPRGDEVLAFKVTEFGLEGASYNTYQNIDALLRDLDRYPKSVAARLNFFRHIRVEKSKSDAQWKIDNPKGDRTGRKKIASGRFDTRNSKG